MALAGGVTIELPHKRGYLYQENEILSPDGHCHAFDADAQGTIFGSGVGVVVLRRLKDAVEDGDQIYAVLKGSAINNDGAAKVGYTAPGVEGLGRALSAHVVCDRHVAALGVARPLAVDHEEALRPGKTVDQQDQLVGASTGDPRGFAGIVVQNKTGDLPLCADALDGSGGVVEVGV